MSSAGPGFLVFSGANDRAVLALCRGFEEYGVPFGLIARGKDDLLKRSRYADRFLVERSSAHLDVDDVIQAARNGQERFGPRQWVVCATSEYLNIRLFELTGRLMEERITVATCPQSLYRLLSDKVSFRGYCGDLGVPPPEILHGNAASNVELPFVAKPKVNLDPNGRILYPYLIRSEKDRAEFLDQAVLGQFYFERFVEGESWYLLYYFSGNGSYVTGAQKNYLQQGKGKSIVLAISATYPETAVAKRFAGALQKDGYRGFIVIELERTGDGQAVAIEANPRCWGPFQLTLDANMGLFEAFLIDHGHQVMPPKAQGVAYYGWMGGIFKAIQGRMGLDRHAPLFGVVRVLLRAVFNDVYGRRGSWSCFLRDL